MSHFLRHEFCYRFAACSCQLLYHVVALISIPYCWIQCIAANSFFPNIRRNFLLCVQSQSKIYALINVSLTRTQFKISFFSPRNAIVIKHPIYFWLIVNIKIQVLKMMHNLLRVNVRNLNYIRMQNAHCSQKGHQSKQQSSCVKKSRASQPSENWRGSGTTFFTQLLLHFGRFEMIIHLFSKS